MKQIPVQDLMNRRVPTVLENASINDAAVALLEYDASEVYVVTRAGVLVGIVPEYAVLKARLCGTARNEPVNGLISRAQTVQPATSAIAVAGLFREAFRSSLAVVDEHGRLLGQIKRREVIWLLTTLDRVEDGEETTHESPSEETSAEVRQPNFLRRRRIIAEQITRSP